MAEQVKDLAVVTAVAWVGSLAWELLLAKVQPKKKKRPFFLLKPRRTLAPSTGSQGPGGVSVVSEVLLAAASAQCLWNVTLVQVSS